MSVAHATVTQKVSHAPFIPNQGSDVWKIIVADQQQLSQEAVEFVKVKKATGPRAERQFAL
jgi:hypothetical protein